MKTRSLQATQEKTASANQLPSLDQVVSPSRNDPSSILTRSISRYLNTQAEKSMFHRNGLIDPVQQRAKERGERYLSPYSLASLGSAKDLNQLPQLKLHTQQTKLARHEQRIDMVNKNVLKAETKEDAIGYFARQYAKKEKENENQKRSGNLVAIKHHSRERSTDSGQSLKINEGSLAYHRKLVKRGGRQPDSREAFLNFLKSTTNDFESREKQKIELHRQATEKQFMKLNDSKMVETQLSKPLYDELPASDLAKVTSQVMLASQHNLARIDSIASFDESASIESTQKHLSMQFDIDDETVASGATMTNKTDEFKVKIDTAILQAIRASVSQSLQRSKSNSRRKGKLSGVNSKARGSIDSTIESQTLTSNNGRSGTKSPPPISDPSFAAFASKTKKQSNFGKQMKPKQNVLQEIMHNRLLSRQNAANGASTLSYSMRNMPTMKKLMKQKSKRRINVVANTEAVLDRHLNESKLLKSTFQTDERRLDLPALESNGSPSKLDDYYSSLTGSYFLARETASLNASREEDGILGPLSPYYPPAKKQKKLSKKSKVKSKLQLNTATQALTNLATKPLTKHSSGILSEISLNSQLRWRESAFAAAVQKEARNTANTIISIQK